MPAVSFRDPWWGFVIPMAKHISRSTWSWYESRTIRTTPTHNLSGQKVGHIQRELAAALAPIVDQRTIPSRGNRWKIPICIEFRVPTQSNKTLLDAVLQQHGLLLHRKTNAPEELQQPTIQTVRVDWKTKWTRYLTSNAIPPENGDSVDGAPRNSF